MVLHRCGQFNFRVRQTTYWGEYVVKILSVPERCKALFEKILQKIPIVFAWNWKKSLKTPIFRYMKTLNFYSKKNEKNDFPCLEIIWILLGKCNIKKSKFYFYNLMSQCAVEYVHNRDFKTYTSANFTSAKASVVSELLSMTGRFLAASILTLTLPGMLRWI